MIVEPLKKGERFKQDFCLLILKSTYTKQLD